MLTPDYDRSILNLVAALCGDQAPDRDNYPPLPELASLGLERRPVLLLVLDGLGYAYLSRHPRSVLYQHLRGRLTSVFPTTTAAAVTGLALGVSARQHSITGWFTYLRELGCVAAPLPMVPRGGGKGFEQLGVEAGQLLDSGPLFSRLERPVQVVSPAYIADSAFSQALFPGVVRQPYTSLRQMCRLLRRALKGGGNPLVWGYWTRFDGLAHEFGINSPVVAEHFAELDQAFGRLIRSLEGSGALVMVTADHGLIDTSPARVVSLEAHPGLQALLRLPLCGEPRAAFCYLNPGAEPAFEAYVNEHLGHCCGCYPSAQLADAGLFGRGLDGARFRERIGDYILLPRENWIFKDRLLQETPFEQIGVHGGLSDEELYVPLILWEDGGPAVIG